MIGIDLGTTHCALAYSPADRPVVRLFAVPQLVAEGERAETTLLPSFLYLPPGDGDITVGTWARALGARSPNQLVASSKSWICHGGVNRRAAVLPWSAPDDARHISPFEASAQLLAHLRAAWDEAHPTAPLAEQEVVVTVPASFDSVARALTAEAAERAGLPEVRLIEEPQAALYDFLGMHDDDLAEQLRGARLALVVDVGGGTTDLTLVRVHPTEGDEAPEIERIAVGGHLMLGGDNMDAALAHFVARGARLDGKLDPTEWSALVTACCAAKERLLGADPPEETVVSIQRRGSRLIGGTKSVTVRRADAERLLVDGFVPRTGPADVPQVGGRAGLTTLGLPYESDPAITRHVCAFLRRHAAVAAEAGAAVVDGLPRPDLLLLNGGVFAADALATRLQEVLAGWFGAPVPLLPHTSLDTAVARGAVRYGLALRGHGLRITGGAARAYYVGIDDTGGSRRALCVAPRGQEEGTRVDVRDRVFDLALGRPVSFPLYSTTDERPDAPGALVDVEGLEVLPPITTAFAAQRDVWGSATVPVTLSAELTERGALELSLATVEMPRHRWRLAFDLEPPVVEPEPEPEVPAEPLPPRFSAVRSDVRRVFDEGRKGRDPKDAKRLRVDLEATLGPRGPWSSTVCRAVADLLLEVAPRRGRTEQHELSWLRLLGWCLRPGLGAPGDRARIEAVWALRAEGLAFPAHKEGWGAWWVLWRRVAAGLDEAAQHSLFEQVAPWLDPRGRTPAGQRPWAPREMMAMVAALELIAPDQKAAAGGWCLERFKKIGSWWVLGRLGSRSPERGLPVAPDVAEVWLDRLLDADASASGATFAAMLMARRTGTADISEGTRARVAAWLAKHDARPDWIWLVREGGELSDTDARQLLGDALPAGLRLR